MKKITVVFDDDDLYTAVKVEAARQNRPGCGPSLLSARPQVYKIDYAPAGQDVITILRIARRYEGTYRRL